MLEVLICEPNAYSASRCYLHEKRVPFTDHQIDMGMLEQFWPGLLAVGADDTSPAPFMTAFVMPNLLEHAKRPARRLCLQ